MIFCIGKKICVLPRSQVHNHNILHNGIGALIASKSADDKEGSYEFFVHKRSNEKRLFPSMNDMLIGGVCGTDEAALDTLYRELKEELNIVITPKHKLYRSNLIQDENDTIIIRLGHKIIKTTYNHCYVDCYLVVCSEFHRQRIQFNDGEIQSGKWMTSNDLIDEVEANPNQYVPDGLQIWRDIGKLLELASVKYA
jgi:8-oxo-dGTP pyrophosphatase MutT (NUDIX family)